MNLRRRIERLEHKAAIRAKTPKLSKLQPAKSSLLEFIQRAKPDYLVDEFHRQLCAIMEQFYQDVLDKKSPRYLVCAPPQHGKSTILSRHFPAWALGRSPWLYIVLGAYGGSLAYDFSDDVQNIMVQPEYHDIFPDTILPRSEWAGPGRRGRRADYFALVGKPGRFRAVGRQGSITGKSAHIVLIDDPVKSHAEAESETMRDNIWHWYNPDLLTRLQQGGGVLLTLTRWHMDDLAGRLLEMQSQPGADQWKTFVFPALSDGDLKLPLTYKEASAPIVKCTGCRNNSGGTDPALHTCKPLAPSRFDHRAMLERRANMIAKEWDSLYQGSPSALTGGILPADKWRYYGGKGQPGLPDQRQFDFIVATWDGTFANTLGADYCCGQVWGCRGAERWLLDYILEKMTFTRFRNAIREMRYKWPRTSWTLIENKANGPAVIDTLQSEITGMTAVEPEGGKIARAWAASSDLAAGNMFLPDPSVAPWVGAFVHRCAVFPANLDKPGSDDDIDAFTQMVIFMRQYRFGVAAWASELQWREEQDEQTKYTCLGPNGETLVWVDEKQLWMDEKTGQTYEPDRSAESSST